MGGEAECRETDMAQGHLRHRERGTHKETETITEIETDRQTKRR